MDTGNCLLIDSLMYIYRKYSFREKVKYVVWLKKESIKITLNFFEPNKRIDVLVVVNNPFNTPFNPTRFYPGMSQEPALKKKTVTSATSRSPGLPLLIRREKRSQLGDLKGKLWPIDLRYLHKAFPESRR